MLWNFFLHHFENITLARHGTSLYGHYAQIILNVYILILSSSSLLSTYWFNSNSNQKPVLHPLNHAAKRGRWNLFIPCSSNSIFHSVILSFRSHHEGVLEKWCFPSFFILTVSLVESNLPYLPTTMNMYT